MVGVKIQWTKLPFTFEPALLREDLARILGGAWKPHFNQQDYVGDWSGLALRSRMGDANDISPHGTAAEFKNTPLMEQCPHLRAVVEAFQFPVKSVRLLRLKAGSRVNEHSDPDLGLADGQLRIHVPVMTSEQVEFVVANRRLILREGESWYIDFSQRHRIYNGGDTDRIHLIIDGEVNAWALALLETSAREIVTESFDPPGMMEFRRFQEIVYDDPVLQTALLSVSGKKQLLEEVVAVGAQRGYAFDMAVVESVFQANRQAWMTRAMQP
jgi:Aspartyl/Asparaginyl beta-hydroxylase